MLIDVDPRRLSRPDVAARLATHGATIGVIATSNVDMGYQAGKNLKLSLGANNLFDRYSTQVNGTVLAHERAYNDDQAVQICPGFSPIGNNGGYYYVRAEYRF